ncbi:MAG TPA: Ig-like domain-containing protein [Mycobacteriales bacterium]|nr:Ig-like domain-containing protein [Mycobacteriales bacterium]
MDWNVAWRRRAARGAARIATVVAVLVGSTFPATAGNSPQGDTAAPWPAVWTTYRLANGDAIHDVVGDENPNNADLSSGPCSGNLCTGPSPTVYYATDGANVFFRMRLAVNPADATKGGLTGNAYLTQVAVNGVVLGVVGVDGKSASADYVYVASAPGTTVSQIYTYPFTAPSAGMRVLPDGAGQWFLDYQVPLARLTAISGGAITSATAIKLYFGSSAAANLATINKDFMIGNAVTFDGLDDVTLAPAGLTTTSAAVPASGPNPPNAGEATTYTVTLTLTNPGGTDLSLTNAVATLPAGVTYVSGPGAVAVAGSTLTWTAGTLLPGETKTVNVTLSLTPAAAGTLQLLSAVQAAGTDAATASPRTATAPALTVTAISNDPPVAANDTTTVAEDGFVAIPVLGNDTDPDGDPLTVGTVSTPAHGSVTETAGVVTYTPAANYTGPDSFTYEACDPSGLCDTATVTITVTPVNDAPPAPPGSSFATPEDTPYSGNLPGSLDADGDALTFAADTAPAHGSVTVGPDGAYTYTPDVGYHGPDSFTYEVCDASGACAGATVTITVTPVNDAPPAPPGDAFTTPEDTAHAGTLPGSVDPDGDALTFGGTTPAGHGTVTVNGDGMYTYTPDAGYVGPDTFGYEVCDPAGACAAATVAVTVTPVNDAPLAVDDTALTPYATPVTLDPTTNDTDAENDALTITVMDPAHGSVSVSGNDVTYTPDAGHTGPDTFTYLVCDAALACDTGTITVTTGPAPDVNLPPVADAGDDLDVPSGAAVTLDGSGSSDPDLDLLTFQWVRTAGPAATLAGASSPAPSFAGVVGPATLTFELTVSDGFLTDTDTVTVTIGSAVPTGEAPTCTDTSADSGQDGVTIGIPCEGHDEDTTQVVVDAAHGDVEVLDSGEVRYEPDDDFTGTDTFTVRVCNENGCAESVVTVEVRDGAVVRPRVVPNAPNPPSAPAAPAAPAAPRLPSTGAATDVLVAAAFLMVAAGLTLQRRPKTR